MKLKNFIAILVLALLSTMANAAHETIDYKNTRGSKLKLHFDHDNTVTGIFITAVASKECPQAVGSERPVTGYIAKDTISISIAYPDCGSVLTFIGNLKNNKKEIETTSILAKPLNQVFASGAGVQFLSHDVFKRVS